MPWDEAARSSLAQHAGELDWVAAGLATVQGQGHVWTYRTDRHLTNVLASSAKTGRRPRLWLMVQNVDESGTWDGANSARLFVDQAAGMRVLDQIEHAALAEGASGVLLDFEALPPQAHRAYTEFLARARTKLMRRGLRLAIAAPVADPAWNLARYGTVCDRVFLMAYDEHWPGGEPGPIASQAWFLRTVEAAIQAIGKDKSVVALGNYAYDWGEGPAEPLTVAQAWQKAVHAGIRPAFDSGSGNSHFAYVQAGIRHDVWLLDALSSWNQVQATRRLGASGVAIWRLGGEDPGLWSVLATREGEFAALDVLPAADGVQLEGKGEVLRLASVARTGLRHAVPGEDGLIRKATFHRLPSLNVVERAGHDTQLVALTFDDGPDPRWTPKILDILKREQAPATFFVTGANALGQSDLLRRILAEGSELGNHSTTHPDLSRLPDAMIRFEINATQRLVESYTGRSLRLFRAPYLGDADPSSAAELRAAKVAADMGYLTVGLNVDPLDWTGAQASQIVQRTLDQVGSGGNMRSTQIVLLHDSGGDRSATIAALPAIVRGLRARGYRLVTVSQLAGIGRDVAMPPLLGPRQAVASGTRTLFSGVSALSRMAVVVFAVAILLGILRAVVMTVLALMQVRRYREPASPAYLIPGFVSILIPAFNEVKVIEASVRRILASTGPRIEVIVIDDGSSDGTSDVVRGAFGLDPRVILLTVANAGKARALNHGLQIARGDVVIALDADTQFGPDTVQRLTRWFADPVVGAVAGNARVGNAVNFVTRAQALEYVTAQGLERRALSALDAVTVVPGAVGAWRRSALDALGGYPADTLAEDQDLTIAVQRAGWKVVCDSTALAWTEAPQSFSDLFRQRYRWAYGTLQCLWKHRAVVLRGSPRGLARFGLPQALLFQIAFSLVAPIIDIALFLSVLEMGLRLHNHGFSMMTGDFVTVGLFWLAFVAIDLACGWIAFRLDRQEQRFPALRLLLQRFVYRQLLYAVVIKALFAALSGPRVAWGKLDRSGQVGIGKELSAIEISQEGQAADGIGAARQTFEAAATGRDRRGGQSVDLAA